MRSKHDEQFRSAFFEIYLHELFVKGGYDVEIHPHLRGTSRRPDFLISRGIESFYVEAKVPGSRPELRGPARREADVLDAINGVDSPTFFLALNRFNSGDQPLSIRRLRKDLKGWLSQLDPKLVGADPLAEKFIWSHDGWTIEALAVAKKVERRGKPGRTIGSYPITGGGVNDARNLRAAIESKAGAYGELGRPFIVAIGTSFFGSFQRENHTALYGAGTPQLDADPKDYRRSDDGGFFGTAPGWRGKRVSGVLVVNQLAPYYVTTANAVLWRHPHPEHPLPEKLSLPVAERRLGADGGRRRCDDGDACSALWAAGGLAGREAMAVTVTGA